MDFIDLLKNYWTLIAAFVGIIYSYLVLKMQNIDQEKRLNHLETKAEELNPILLEIRTKLASIEATLVMLIKK